MRKKIKIILGVASLLIAGITAAGFWRISAHTQSSDAPGKRLDQLVLIVAALTSVALVMVYFTAWKLVSAAERKYKGIFENATEGIFRVAPTGRYLAVNPAFAHICGYDSPAQLAGALNNSPDKIFVAPERRDEFVNLVTDSGSLTNWESEIFRKDGKRIWIRESAHCVRDEKGQVLFLQGMVCDASEQKLAEVLDADSRRILEMVVRNQPVAGALQAIVALLERQRDGLLAAVMQLKDGQLQISAAPNLPAEFTSTIDGTVLGPDSGSAPAAAYHKRNVMTADISSEPCWRDQRDLAAAHDLAACWAVPIVSGTGSEVLGTIAAYFNKPRQATPADVQLLETAAQLAAVAIEQNRLTSQLIYQSQHDALTELPNRALFQDRLRQTLADATLKQLALFFIDVDDFKLINETLGHQIGDMLLQQIATRLRGRVRRSDTLVRMGGDEFTLVLPGMQAKPFAEEVARKLMEAFRMPFEVGGHELHVSASIGISLFPEDGQDAATLQRNADAAMYRAKSQGRNRFEFFDPKMNQAMHERMELESQLRRAIENEELELHYQPRVDSGGTIVGLEALLRWRHPRLGLIPPAKFIPVAEESGLIVPIGAWVLREACRQAKAWQQPGFPKIRMAANVSALQFAQADFTATVIAAMAAAELEPSALELEITESLLMHNTEDAALKLNELRALGVAIAIDDFGTGYSSLAYLQRLPIDTLKIDRSFVFAIDAGANQHSTAVIRAITSLAHTLQMKVVAEGVETEAQQQFLHSLGVDGMQGFLFSPPQPAALAASLLRAGVLPQRLAAIA